MVKTTWWRQTPNNSACPSGTLLGVEAFQPSHDEPGGGVERVVFAGEGGEGDFGDLDIGDPAFLGVQASSAMCAIASRVFFLTATVRENRAPALRQTSRTLWEKNAESARTLIYPVMPAPDLLDLGADVDEPHLVPGGGQTGVRGEIK
ncbi:hypothetical protein ACH437_28155 [Streptomyces xinghaiensis]|uniref:hypothetical protein n=1 Tax=Streptomyces xinghaiensis TaxID=1038928 RepID=UPI00378E3CB1